MFLVDSLKTQLAEASTIFVHIALIVSVAVYTLFGAFSMQYLESPERVRSQIKRDAVDRATETAESPYHPEKNYKVYLGRELVAMDPGVRRCVERTLMSIFGNTNCRPYAIEHLDISGIDHCYQDAEVPHALGTVFQFAKPRPSPTEQVPIEPVEAVEPVEKWSFGNAVIFAFTVITTIGYGHVAPETFEGRLFCIIYGVVGVPFTLLTVADLGMFLTKMLRKFLVFVHKTLNACRKCCFKPPKTTATVECEQETSEQVMTTAREPGDPDPEDEEGPPEDDVPDPRKTEESVLLGLTFACYLVAGAKVLSVYEPEMDFFKALYFNFVTLTTIGLGDFVPKSFDYLFVTLLYIGVGLALTTMAIEIAADVLRKLHYAGRKMENVASTVVWFGGKKMTMKNLVQYLGDQFNIPEDQLANFELDKFVDEAIKVEKGEIKTLRKPQSPVTFRERAFSFSNMRKSSESNLHFADELRLSKLAAAANEPAMETARTLDTLQAMVANDAQLALIPRLDLDYQYFSDMSAPTSFDEHYLRTFSVTRN